MQANLSRRAFGCGALSNIVHHSSSSPGFFFKQGHNFGRNRQPTGLRCLLEYRSFSRSSPRLVQEARDGECYDFTIVGGGIVGCATGMELAKKYPKLKMAIVEKEDKLGAHQSGHNSGVIHAGIYYTPGSLKAKLCVDGLHLSYKYLDENRIPYKKCGKLIVAVSQEQIPRLKNLYERGLQNNVPNLELISKEKIKDYEPHCEGLMALWSPETGIVDWGQVTRSYGDNFEKSGGKIHLNFPVAKFQSSTEDKDHPVMIFNDRGKVKVK